MKLLLYDPDYISHSVDVFRRHLVPELANRVDHLVWVAPSARHSEFHKWLSPECRLTLIEIEYPRAHPLRWIGALLRRVSSTSFLDNQVFIHLFKTWLLRTRLDGVSRAFDVDNLFCLAFMNQLAPETSVPISGILHDLSPDLPSASLANIDKWLNKALIVFCVSNFTKAELLSRFGSQHQPSVKVVPPYPQRKVVSSSADIRHDHAVTPNHSLPSKLLRCFIPATLQERKGHRVLLEAAISALSQDVSLSLTFVGSGSELLLGSQACSAPYLTHLGNLLQDFQAKGGFCQALGHVEDCQFSELLECSDVVVFPSLFEGFGLPVSEAVMAGLPVIASDLAPIREQLDLFNCHHRVHLVAPGDPDLLASALVEFANGGGPSRVPPNDLSENFKQWSWGMAAESIVGHLERAMA